MVLDHRYQQRDIRWHISLGVQSGNRRRSRSRLNPRVRQATTLLAWRFGSTCCVHLERWRSSGIALTYEPWAGFCDGALCRGAW